MIMQEGDVCGDVATRNQTRFDAYPLKVAGQRERSQDCARSMANQAQTSFAYIIYWDSKTKKGRKKKEKKKEISCHQNIVNIVP